MAGRPVSKRANLPELRKLKDTQRLLLDTRPLIAFVMKHSGCTYSDIGAVMDCTRQMAQTLVEKVEREL